MSNNYNLKELKTKSSPAQFAGEISQYLDGAWVKIWFTVGTVILSSAAEVAVPFLIIVSIDQYIAKGNLAGLVYVLVALFGIFVFTSGISYFQTITTSRISQQILHTLKRDLFNKVQSFPLDFFNQNKSGDIISRINNDTEKLNNFFGQSVFQFVRNFFTFVGIGVFIFWVNLKLAIVVWLPVLLVVLFNQIITNKVREANKTNLEANGDMSAFLDENINNFRALVVFNKREYLRESFAEVNHKSYLNKIKSQVLNGIFQPIYAFAGNLSQVLVLVFGIFLIGKGEITAGILVGFLSYAQKFYQPLQILGSVWGTLQEALAAWDRIQNLLRLK
jgi:ATP-binding cassette, subfamily B, bacterial